MDYLSIASPNHLHYPQIRMALRLGANALSEKPLVLWPEEIARLKELGGPHGKAGLHRAPAPGPSQPPGPKGAPGPGEGGEGRGPHLRDRAGEVVREELEGGRGQERGLATNIGIHFFDLLAWLFGRALHVEVHARTPR